MRSCLVAPLVVILVLGIMVTMFVALWAVPVVIVVWAIGWWVLTQISARRGRVRSHGYDRED